MGNTKYKQRHRKLGLCYYCSEPAIPFSRLCEKHTLTHYHSSRKYHVENIELVRKKSRLRKQQRRKEGRCTDCGKPLDGDMDSRIVCFNCSAKIRRPYWVKNGIAQKKGAGKP